MLDDGLTSVNIEVSLCFEQREAAEVCADERIGIILREWVLAATVTITKRVDASEWHVARDHKERGEERVALRLFGRTQSRQAQGDPSGSKAQAC